MRYSALFLSLIFTFSISLKGAYGDDYGCENSTILGTSYYTSWTPTSITTGEGYCSSEDVPVDVGGIIVGTLVLIGIIWLFVPDGYESNEDTIFKLYTSQSELGASFLAIPKKYYLRAVINNPLKNDQFFLQDRNQIFESNFDADFSEFSLKFGINF